METYMIIVLLLAATIRVATPLVLGRGYRFEVNFLGKVATWFLYGSLGFVMCTHASTRWPLWLFWTGFGDHFAIGLLAGMLMIIMIIAWDQRSALDHEAA